MARIRSCSIEAYHAELAQLTLDWEGGTSSLPRYVVRFGIPHLVFIGQREAAISRLLDVPFMHRVLDAWPSFVEPLKFWRTLGVEHLHRYTSSTLKPPAEADTFDLEALAVIGGFLEEAGRLESADVLLSWVLAANEAILGMDHIQTLKASRDCARLSEAQGNYALGKALAERALKGLETSLGREHPQTLGARTVLANLLLATGSVTDACAMYELLLEQRRSVNGSDHPETIGLVNNLGCIRFRERDYESAAVLFRDALDCRERVLGVEHPATINTIQNLASALHLCGDLATAEQLYQRAVESSRRVLGADHPDTVQILGNIGNLQVDLGDCARGEQTYRLALTGYAKLLGPGHPATIGISNNLSALLREQSRFDEAEALGRVSLRHAIEQLGGRHPDVERSMLELATTLCRRPGGVTASELHGLVRELLTCPAGERLDDPTGRAMGNLIGSIALKLRGRGHKSDADALWSYHRGRGV
jgi:tetratricopeptide (TPR) repeat protein